jgi:hypothetical protein
MVDVEQANHTAPLLSIKAVDATKRELVAELRAIALRIGISSRPVTTDVRL